MINIRYHIVSITAIFLALGIGTLLGSTFLDRATVDQLDRNIRNAEARIADTEAENSRLQSELDEAEARDLGLVAASRALLAGRLTDVPTVLVVAPGVDQGVVDGLRVVLGSADADVRATMSLDEDLADGDISDDVLEALDVATGRPAAAAREDVVGLLLDALVAAGAPVPDDEPDAEEPATTLPGEEDPAEGPAEPADPGDVAPPEEGATTLPEDPAADPEDVETPEGTPTTEDGADDDPAPTPDGDQPEVLTVLAAAGLVAIDPGPGHTDDAPILEQVGYRYVFVTQSGLAPSSDELLLALLPPGGTDPRLPVVVVTAEVEVVDEDEQLDDAVALVRADPDRRSRYSTVDDVNTFLGLSSTVTLLATESTDAGHYGQGEGATALAPIGR